MTKTVIFGFRSVPKQMECMYEIAIDRVKAGHDVELAWGAEDIHFCENYTLGKGGLSSVGARPFYKIFDLVNENLVSLSLNDCWLKTAYLDHPKITLEADTVFDYFSLEAGEFEIGSIAVSVVTSFLNVDVTKLPVSTVNPIFERVVSSVVNVHDKAKAYLTTVMPDEVIVFNGRFGPEAAVADVAKSLGIPVFYYEVMHEKNSYKLWEFPIHSITGQKSLMADFWASGSADKARIAKEWVETRAGSSHFRLNERFEMKFNKNSANLREELSISKKFIVFYQTSDDEYIGLPASTRGKRPWRDQAEALELIDSIFGDQYQIVVRIHPHMSIKNPIEKKFWRNFANGKPSMRFVFEDQLVDSYALGLASEFAVIGGDSTIGAELLYFGVPVVCMSEALYDESRGCVSVKDRNDLLKLDLSQQKPVPDDLLPYFYFQSEYSGNPCAYTKFGDGWQSEFMGVDQFK